MQKIGLGVALAAAVIAVAATTSAAAEIRPGMALSPDDLPPEAQHYERLLRADATEEPLGWDDDSVDERRHFDDRLLQVGFGTGVGTPIGLMGAYLEANPWDGLSLGVGAGFTSWGPAGGVSLRLRPFVWGGQGQRALHAFTLQTSYTYMRHGRDPLRDFEFGFYDCEVGACPEPEPDFVPTGAHFMSLSAGFEHALASGWTFRYELGFARALRPTSWGCVLDGRSTPCTNSSPSDTLLVVGFAVSHAL
jgi:hypothetical protein